MGQPTRRTLLLAGLGLPAMAGLSGVRAAADPAPTVEAFRALSARLMQKSPSALDAGVAETLLSGLMQTGRGPALTALLRNPESDAALAGDIVTAWYSGVYRTADGEAVASFTDALIWDALDFTKPFASCGGETGYWAGPPQV